MPGVRTSAELAVSAIERVGVVSARGREYLAANFADGAIVLRPLDWYPTLAAADARRRRAWRLVGDGHGVSWPSLDLDLSAEGILVGRPDMTLEVRGRLPIEAALAAALAQGAAPGGGRRSPVAAMLRSRLTAAQLSRLLSSLERSGTSKRPIQKRRAAARRSA
ncbi:MAG: DUF2442 domain-containing protein [Phycisphaerales bacterium]|nr:DUF2442 domain-containing protein [Phycisphaerales bacterium]